MCLGKSRVEGERLLERQKVIADAALEAAGTPPVVRLHPNLAEVYREKVAALEVALNAPTRAPRQPRSCVL